MQRYRQVDTEILRGGMWRQRDIYIECYTGSDRARVMHRDT